MSHNSHRFDPNAFSFLKDSLKDVQKEIGGTFPDGKLTSQDEGAMALAVGAENGKVVLHFANPVAWIGFTPDQAVQLAENILKHARKIGTSRPFTLSV